MKSKLIILAVITAIVMIQPTTASAINKEWSAALGFLGGVLVGNACGPGPAFAPPPPARGGPPPAMYQPPPPPPPPQPSGRYEYREERVWVSGRWIVVVNRGCQQRIWQEGYYRTRLVKVWVPAPCPPLYSRHSRRGWR